jgi:hypothetical protein
MSAVHACRPSGPEGSLRQRGAILVTVMLLLLVVSTLGLAALVMASLELQMSANFQHQERAFQAAEFAIEQALRSPDLSTAHTMASPKQLPAAGADPLVPGSATDTYRYSLYYDTSAGSTAVPDGAALGPGIAAYHFIIEATGRSSRGAEDTHTQSFYVLVPAGCLPGVGSCGSLPGYVPTRSYWAQKNAE